MRTKIVPSPTKNLTEEAAENEAASSAWYKNFETDLATGMRCQV